MKTSLVATAVLSTGFFVGSAAPTAWATFVESATATSSFSAAVLSPPTVVTASEPTCGAGGYSAQLSWSASSSTWLDGYEVAMRAEGSGSYTVVPRPAGVSPTATARTLSGLTRKTTYDVVVRTTRSAWRAESAAVVVTTASRNC